MKKRNGFTLLELLAVIIVLAIIALIAVPTVIGIINKVKEKAYDKQVQVIEEAARTWSVTNKDKLPYTPSPTKFILGLDRLISDGLLANNIKNPKTGKNMAGCVLITYNSEGNNHNYNYHNLNDDSDYTCKQVYGDINIDGEVNIDDYNLLKSMLDNNVEMTELQKANGDLDLNGIVNKQDLGFLFYYVKDNAFIKYLPYGSGKIFGDVNYDGSVTEDDANLIRKYLSGEVSFNDEEVMLADFNLDGVVNSADIEAIMDILASPFNVKLNTINNYVYKVGNLNEVTLDTFFSLQNGSNIDNKKVLLTIYDENHNQLSSSTSVSATYSKEMSSNEWKSKTIKFKGTGRVVLALGTSSKRTELTLDVIDATNAKNYEDVKSVSSQNKIQTNLVLLDDITITNDIVENQYKLLLFSSKNFYGNGFTIHAENFVSPSNNQNTKGIIALSGNANMDRVILRGPIYPEIDYYGDKDWTYFISGLLVSGNAKVTNSYVSGGREAVRMDSGDVVFENSIIDGGVMANMFIYNATTLTLKNVTTIQNAYDTTVGTSKKVKGVGIFIGEKATSGVKLIIDGYFNQYNWISKSDESYLTATEYKTLIEQFFNNYGTTFSHNNGEYLNAGITAHKSAVITGNQLYNTSGSKWSVLPYTYQKITYKLLGIINTDAGQTLSITNSNCACTDSNDNTNHKYELNDAEKELLIRNIINGNTINQQY